MGGSASTLDMAHAVAGILSATHPSAKS